MAKDALESFEPGPGKKRRKPTVIATATVSDVLGRTGGGSVDTGGQRDVVPIDTVRQMTCDVRYTAPSPTLLGTWLDGGDTEPAIDLDNTSTRQVG